MKICSKCKIEKDESEFYPRNRACKVCYNLVAARYRETTQGKEAAKRADLKYRKTEKRKQAFRTYKQSNCGSSKIKQIEKRYRQSDNGRLVMQQKARRRRERKLSLDPSFSRNDVELVYRRFNHKCFYCTSTSDLSIDHHYPLSRGYSLKLDNAVLLCRSCNAAKGSKMPEEFYSEKQLLELANIFT